MSNGGVENVVIYKGKQYYIISDIGLNEGGELYFPKEVATPHRIEKKYKETK